MNLKENYANLIADKLNSDKENIFFYWKGRVALYTALKAIGIKSEDEVILPAFTCVVVPNAIKYLGGKPIYVDVTKTTYNTTLEHIKQKINSKTKAVIIQNTFGLSSEVELIQEYCSKKNIITLEDCTHGFGGSYNNKPNGTYCDFAFYSTQWNKPFSTGVGGFLLVNNKSYLEKVANLSQQLITPSFKDRTILKSLIFARENVLTPNNYWRLIKLYRWLSKNKIVVGSSSPEELNSIEIPENYFKSGSNVQYKTGIKNLKKLSQILLLRSKNASIYSMFLKENNKSFVAKDLFQNHSFLKYPILVKDREQFLQLAEQNKIDLGEWFNSPLHPIQGDLTEWNLIKEDYPISNEVSSQMVNLPTDTDSPEKVIEFLENNLDFII